MAREVAQTRAAPAPRSGGRAPTAASRLGGDTDGVARGWRLWSRWASVRVDVPVRKLVLALLGRDSLTADQRIIILTFVFRASWRRPLWAARFPFPAFSFKGFSGILWPTHT